MEVLNKKERSKAFVIFILFFCVTILVFVLSLTFNVFFPFMENTIIKEENDLLKKEIDIQDNFSFQLEKVKQSVDSIGLVDSEYKDDYFNEKLALSQLAEMYRQIPVHNKNMYGITILAFKELIDSKNQVKELTLKQGLADSLNTINGTKRRV